VCTNYFEVTHLGNKVLWGIYSFGVFILSASLCCSLKTLLLGMFDKVSILHSFIILQIKNLQRSRRLCLPCPYTDVKQKARNNFWFIQFTSASLAANATVMFGSTCSCDIQLEQYVGRYIAKVHYPLNVNNNSHHHHYTGSSLHKAWYAVRPCKTILKNWSL